MSFALARRLRSRLPKVFLTPLCDSHFKQVCATTRLVRQTRNLILFLLLLTLDLFGRWRSFRFAVLALALRRNLSDYRGTRSQKRRRQIRARAKNLTQ